MSNGGSGQTFNSAPPSGKSTNEFNYQWLLDRRPIVCRVCDQVCSNSVGLLLHYQTHQVDDTTSFTNHNGRSIPIAQSATNRPGNPNLPTLMPQIPQNQICHSMLHRNVPNPQFSVPVTKPLVKKVEKLIEEVVISLTAKKKMTRWT
nr:hypothetical protein Iba_chr12aCG8230 [Ipomoea batatas]